jgi:hypothetical protein
MRLAPSFVAVLALAGLAACETQTAVTAIGQDHARVTAVGDDIAPVNAQGVQACAMFKRRAVAMSWRCLDGYCLQKEYLFACVPE